jgi:tRNA (pseudouridine54-N1)-methyltransferase
MRRFVVIGRDASASDDFLLEDVPGTSGRLDVGLRCVRAALLVSHGVRAATVYLVLGGGPRAPRVLRIQGGVIRFVRPDERSLAILAKKALARDADSRAAGFVEIRPGLAIARGGVDAVLDDLGHGGHPLYLLEEGAGDVRDVPEIASPDAVFVLGDHLGFDDPDRQRFAARGARSISVGPTSLHAEDAITVLWNEIDRREQRP